MARSLPKKCCHFLQFVLEIFINVLYTGVLILQALFYLVFPAPKKSIKGEIVLVTGAGHGIGRELALEFSQHGAVVICWDINERSNAATVHEITQQGGQAHGFLCDVSSRASVLEAAKTVRQQVGDVNILVNNAGIMPVNPLLKWSEEDLQKIFSINIMAHFWTLQAFLPAMMEKNHGHIVAVSSMAGLCGLANKIPYSATKFSVAGLMDALSEELRMESKDIKVTCVHPYFIHTRPDLPEVLDLRLPQLSPQFAAHVIVAGVREQKEVITVPRSQLLLVRVLRALPQEAGHRWRDLFYTRVKPKTVVKETASDVINP